MVDGPAEGDHPAPIVAKCDHRSVESDRIGEVGEIADSAGERSALAGALREAHFELIDGDYPPGLGSGTRRVRCRRDELAPQIRPGGIAVHAEYGADRF